MIGFIDKQEIVKQLQREQRLDATATQYAKHIWLAALVDSTILEDNATILRQGTCAVCPRSHIVSVGGSSAA